MRWTVSEQPPADWPELVQGCGGGFFHSPLGLRAGAPSGVPVYLTLWRDESRVGVAAGVRHRCGISSVQRHVYLPTLPALSEGVERRMAMELLRAVLRQRGYAEIVIDSFDARWTPGAELADEGSLSRTEFVAHLDDLPETPTELPKRLCSHHRRLIRRGEREGWSFRALPSGEARALLSAVQGNVSLRAARRHDPFEVSLSAVTALTRGDVDTETGVAVFSAWDAAAPLGAMLVGWTGRRAYGIMGGSTDRGYRRQSAVWLHWRIMQEFAARGFQAYNLGGVPAAAGEPGHPAHGLYDFKASFGFDGVHCSGLRWTLSGAHAKAHTVVRAFRSMVSQGRAAATL